jgi:hypothetical protein
MNCEMTAIGSSGETGFYSECLFLETSQKTGSPKMRAKKENLKTGSYDSVL